MVKHPSPLRLRWRLLSRVFGSWWWMVHGRIHLLRTQDVALKTFLSLTGPLPTTKVTKRTTNDAWLFTLPH